MNIKDTEIYFNEIKNYIIELDKVKEYSNSYKVDDDFFAWSVCLISTSSLYASCIPVLSLERSLLYSINSKDEYMCSLACRTYIEVAGRLHKGVRLLKVYMKDKKIDLKSSVQRLLAKYQPTDKSEGGVIKGKGFNIMTIIKSLDDVIPDISESYDSLSNYVHGDFYDQFITYRISRLFEASKKNIPSIENNALLIEKLRKSMLDDLKILMVSTERVRAKVDKQRTSDGYIRTDIGDILIKLTP